jgi:hypothetical protein
VEQVKTVKIVEGAIPLIHMINGSVKTAGTTAQNVDAPNGIIKVAAQQENTTRKSAKTVDSAT